MVSKTGVFIDISNLYYCVAKKFRGRKVDYGKYLDVVLGNQPFYRAYAYGAQLGFEASKFVERLKKLGFTLKYKRPKQHENNDIFNFDILDKAVKVLHDQSVIPKETPPTFSFDDVTTFTEALTTLKTLCLAKRDQRKADWDVGLAVDIVRIIDRLDLVIIGSADGDLAPLVEWIRERGCRCVVYACDISSDLRDVADEFIEIETNILEIKYDD